jgi:hypothetical protein
LSAAAYVYSQSSIVHSVGVPTRHLEPAADEVADQGPDELFAARVDASGLAEPVDVVSAAGLLGEGMAMRPSLPRSATASNRNANLPAESAWFTTSTS